jgi:hypothetical protein
MASRREPLPTPLAASLTGDDTSLVDLVDSLLGKGVVVDGEVVLGLAGIDLIYLRLAALLTAADRVRSGRSPAAPPAPGASPLREPEPATRLPVADEAQPLVLADLADSPAPSYESVPVRVRPADEVEPAPSPGPRATMGRWNPDPEEVRKGVMKLVLALAELIRQLLERQAIRRMEAGTLTEDETERLGTALSQIESTLREIAEGAGLDPAEINLDLGPLGKLL